jgi:hypothetical protein
MKRSLICLLLAACTAGSAPVVTPPNSSVLGSLDLRVKYGGKPLSPVSFMESGHPPPVVIKNVGHTAILHLTRYNAVVLASNQPWIGQVTCSETKDVVMNGRNTHCIVRRDTFIYMVKPRSR